MQMLWPDFLRDHAMMATERADRRKSGQAAGVRAAARVSA
jgi:hypothetical protein